MIGAEDQSFFDVFGRTVILTGSVRETILSKHPEVSDFLHLTEAVLKSPDEVRQSVSHARTLLYYRYVAEILDGKWIVIVVKRADHDFVSTIYATDKIKSGEVIWKK
jgi:hypothetical protein